MAEWSSTNPIGSALRLRLSKSCGVGAFSYHLVLRNYMRRAAPCQSGTKQRHRIEVELFHDASIGTIHSAGQDEEAVVP